MNEIHNIIEMILKKYNCYDKNKIMKIENEDELKNIFSTINSYEELIKNIKINKNK